MGPVFLFLWLMVSTVILLNVFVAILCEAYAIVTAEDAEDNTPSLSELMRWRRQVKKALKLGQKLHELPPPPWITTKDDGDDDEPEAIDVSSATCNVMLGKQNNSLAFSPVILLRRCRAR